MPLRVLMAFPLAVLLGGWLCLAPAGAWAADGDKTERLSLPEPPNTVRFGGHSVAMQVQSSLGRAAANRMSTFSGGGSGDRKRRFRRAVTCIVLMLAAAVVFLKFMENDEPPKGGDGKCGPGGPGGAGGGPASDKKPGERPPGPREF